MKRTLALSLLLSLALVACKGSGQTIKIGFIGPLTGDAAALGTDMLHGVQMAVDAANAAGGVNGMQVELIAEDGKCAGADAASAAQKLVNVDKVMAIVGGLCSGETLAAAPIAEAGHVVLLSPTSSSPDVTNAGDFVFRNYPSDALKSIAMAKYFKDKGYKKVAMLSENTDFSQGFRKALKAQVGDAVAFDEVFEPGTKDFRTLLGRLKDVPFDVFFPNPNGDSTMAILVQQFREQGFTQPMISHDVAESMVIPQTAGEAAEGFRLINVPTVGEGDFEKAFTAKFGAPQASITWGAFSIDAANVLLSAFTAGKTDGPAIRDYLYALPSYKGLTGEFHFDKNGDVVGIPYALKEFQKGKIVKLQDISVGE